MKVLRSFLLCCAACTLFYGCGKQHKAESVVSGFIKQNTTLSDYSVEFAPIDSTDRIKPGRMTELRNAVSADPLFRRGTTLGSLPQSGKYVYTRTKIINGNDTAVRTFYLDTGMTQVVAFKLN